MATRAIFALASLLLLSIPSIGLAECPSLTALRRNHFWSATDQRRCELCGFNVVEVGRDRFVTWNGAPTTQKRLRSYLRQARRLDPQPITLLILDKYADCFETTRIIDMVSREIPCSDGVCPYALVARPIRR